MFDKHTFKYLDGDVGLIARFVSAAILLPEVLT